MQRKVAKNGIIRLGALAIKDDIIYETKTSLIISLIYMSKGIIKPGGKEATSV